MAVFLNLTGLARFWSNVKAYVDSAISTAKTAVGNYTINGQKISSNPTILSNVTNDAQVKRSEMGVANGVATLDENRLVPTEFLPSYVDDVVEFTTIISDSSKMTIKTESINSSDTEIYIYYLYDKKTFVASKEYTFIGNPIITAAANWGASENFPEGNAYGSSSNNGRIPVAGKIYVDKTTNKTYRWSGSDLVEISSSLALGETSSTAYPGDKGAAAYKHAVTNKGAAFSSDLYKITTNAEGHVTAATKAVKDDIVALGLPEQDTTYGIATASTAGLVKPISVITKPTINSASTTSGKYYHVQMSSDGNMFVNVPWTDNNTTYSTATSSTAGVVKLGSDTEQTVAANSVTATSGRTYAIQKNSSGQMVVNVPWTDTVDTAISDEDIDALFE